VRRALNVEAQPADSLLAGATLLGTSQYAGRIIHAYNLLKTRAELQKEATYAAPEVYEDRPTMAGPELLD
jgi:hypothetical protein